LPNQALFKNNSSSSSGSREAAAAIVIFLPHDVLMVTWLLVPDLQSATDPCMRTAAAAPASRVHNCQQQLSMTSKTLVWPQVCSVDGCGIRRTHGHLPAAVACHLAPLMDKGQVLTQVTLRQPVQAAAGAVRRAASEPPSSSSRGTRASSGTPHALDDTAAILGSQDSQPLLLRDPPADPNSSGAQQQQQQRLQLHITLLQPADADAATAALSAVDRATSAGLESLQPGRSSGALLAAAFDHIMSETR
jgi:hypothetical protein